MAFCLFKSDFVKNWQNWLTKLIHYGSCDLFGPSGEFGTSGPMGTRLCVWFNVRVRVVVRFRFYVFTDRSWAHSQFYVAVQLQPWVSPWLHWSIYLIFVHQVYSLVTLLCPSIFWEQWNKSHSSVIFVCGDVRLLGGDPNAVPYVFRV